MKYSNVFCYNGTMEKRYLVGEIAKIVNVSERTIRYYDSIGLLTPSMIMENGYRMYTQSDLLKLQQIILLKQLGFRIKDIFLIVTNEDSQRVKTLMQTQIGLLEKQIRHLQKLKETMDIMEKKMDHEQVDWEEIAQLIQMSNAQETIIEHYKDSYHLSARIQLHEQYSINKEGWFAWLYHQMHLQKFQHILELGCGDGKLWQHYDGTLQNVDVFISDVSMGMVEEAKKKGPKEFHYMGIDICNIPFKNDYFDCVIANHVLFYLDDVMQGIAQIHRVMQEGGVFYCTTYGANHMKELTLLAKAFDSRIKLSEQNLFEKFGLEHGEQILKMLFSSVEKKQYIDALEVHDAQPIYDYIMSCHGNQVEIIGNRLKEFKAFIQKDIKEKKGYRITKEAGMFICRK